MGWLNAVVNGLGNFGGSDDVGSIASTALMSAGAASGNPALMMAGSQISNAQSAKAALQAQKDANAENIAFQRETNSTSIELANTAHQREVKDLAAAGLNPILSAKYGGSATPSIGSPVTQALSGVIQNSAKQSADITTSDVGFRQAAALQSSQIALNSATAAKTAMEAKTVAAKLPAVKAESDLDAAAATHRMSRPGAANKAGWDVSDFINTINPFKGWFK